MVKDYCPAPRRAGNGASAPCKADLASVARSAKEDKQPRQPGHGVVQTGLPLKRPDPRPFKEQTALSHWRHNTTQLALCNIYLAFGRRSPPGFNAECNIFRGPLVTRGRCGTFMRVAFAPRKRIWLIYNGKRTMSDGRFDHIMRGFWLRLSAPVLGVFA